MAKLAAADCGRQSPGFYYSITYAFYFLLGLFGGDFVDFVVEGRSGRRQWQMGFRTQIHACCLHCDFVCA